MSLKITQRDNLHRGGFAGLKETRLVMSQDLFGPHQEPGTSSGLGTFVYLADAVFNPHGQTNLHPHRDMTIVTIMVEGRINHEGSLEDGTALTDQMVQIQQSGTGMQHNEINPDAEPNRMLQLWFLPHAKGLTPDYQTYNLLPGQVISVLGNEDNGNFKSGSHLQVGLLKPSEAFQKQGTIAGYIAKGSGQANGQDLQEGDFFEGSDLDLKATSDLHFLVVSNT